MGPTKIHRVIFRAFYSPLGTIDARLLGECHHKTNYIVGEDVLLNESVVPLL